MEAPCFGILPPKVAASVCLMGGLALDRTFKHSFYDLRLISLNKNSPKYPMIHDNDFRVLLIFKGFPTNSQCLSASRDRKQNVILRRSRVG